MQRERTPPWYVLTGGPHSGAGTLLRELAIHGYHTLPELARHHIDRGNVRGVPTEKIRKDEAAFQKLVLALKIKAEDRLKEILPSTHETVFLERGIPDSIPYFQLNGLDTREVEGISRNRYRKVFWLEPVPGYQRDNARTEDPITAMRLGELLKEAYSKLGYSVVPVPLMPLEERAEFVLDNLQSKN